MDTSEIFETLLQNLKVGDENTLISSRRDEITKALNKEFRSNDSSSENRLMVGSYGRHTAIRNVSDLDMLYILPSEIRSEYNDENGPRRILDRVKLAIQRHYSATEIRVDQCVVRVQFTSKEFKFEVQPVFENDDKTFDYPDTESENWKVTKPRAEIQATRECNARTTNRMRHLARMTRAWRNTNGVNMGGLLIDTLVHRFFSATDSYDSAPYASYGLMVRDFFEYLSEEPDQSHYAALGSGQRVKVKSPFQAKAKKAYDFSVDAIEQEGKARAAKEWRKIFGTSAPLESSNKQASFDDNEEFVEDLFRVDIRHSLTIDCLVTQNGFRTEWLREMLNRRALLLPNKTLDFSIKSCDATYPYEVRWKVLNRGSEAERRNEIRGQIIESRYLNKHKEQTRFPGRHIVECYIIKDGVVVARDQIRVPIGDSRS